MATSKEYSEYVKEQLSGIDGVTFRPMMGEYIVYFDGRIIGGIYDDRLLVKNTSAAKRLMPDAPLVYPYDGAKQMLSVDNVDDKEFLKQLFFEMLPELPVQKKR